MPTPPTPPACPPTLRRQLLLQQRVAPHKFRLLGRFAGRRLLRCLAGRLLGALRLDALQLGQQLCLVVVVVIL